MGCGTVFDTILAIGGIRLNRRSCKEKAKKQVAQGGNGPKRTTLIFLLCSAVLLALELAASEYTGGSGGRYLSDSVSSEARGLVVSFGVSLVLQLALALLTAGYTRMTLQLRLGKTSGWNVLLDGFRSPGRALLLYLLKMVRIALWSYVFCLPAAYGLVLAMAGEAKPDQNLIMAVSYIYILLVMFIVSYRYRMAWFVLLEEPELSAGQALKKAVALNRGHRKEIFLMDLSFLPWLLLSAATLGILLIWKLPYITASYNELYQQMKEDLDRRERRVREYMNRPA